MNNAENECSLEKIGDDLDILLERTMMRKSHVVFAQVEQRGESMSSSRREV